MFGQHTRDVIIDDDDFVRMTDPLHREHADRGRATTNAHQAFGDAIHNRRLARLHHDFSCVVIVTNHQCHGFTVAQFQQRVAGHAALFLGTAGEVLNTAQRQHL